ncbi:MAG: hypothetical protein AAFY28_18735, partial [Actinomycetota bacterium]
LVVALMSGATIAAAWTLRIDSLGLSTAFVASIESTSMTATIAPEALWSSRTAFALAASPVVLDDAEVEFSDPRLAGSQPGEATRVVLVADRATLVGFSLDPETTFDIARTAPAVVDVAVMDGAAAGNVQFSGSGTVRTTVMGADQATPFEVVVPEILSFDAAVDGPARSARLQFTLQDSVGLERIPVTAMGFSRPTPAETTSQPAFESSVMSASIELPQVGEAITAYLGERLGFEGVDATIRELELGLDGTVRATVVGRADRLIISGETYDRNLSPSILRFLIESQPLTFFLAATTSLFGLIWGLRRWL